MDVDATLLRQKSTAPKGRNACKVTSTRITAVNTDGRQGAKVVAKVDIKLTASEIETSRPELRRVHDECRKKYLG